MEGEPGNKVFVKHVGIYDFVSFDFKNYQNISYNPDLSQIEFESPTTKFEEIKLGSKDNIIININNNNKSSDRPIKNINNGDEEQV